MKQIIILLLIKLFLTGCTRYRVERPRGLERNGSHFGERFFLPGRGGVPLGGGFSAWPIEKGKGGG